jgi:hypothetical protein
VRVLLILSSRENFGIGGRFKTNDRGGKYGYNNIIASGEAAA